jgi:signal transduction histidine kinase
LVVARRSDAFQTTKAHARASVAERVDALLARGAGASQWIATLALGAGILLWTALITKFDTVPFAVLNPAFYGATESATALALVFGAVALFLFPATGSEHRMRWFAFGLATLAVGGLAFNAVFGASSGVGDVNSHVFAAIVVRTSAIALMAVGLLPGKSPRLTLRRAAVIAFVLVLLGFASQSTSALRPRLVQSATADPGQWANHTLFLDFTIWHWLFASVALVITGIVVLRILRSRQDRSLPQWLPVAMVILGGSHLHGMLWPSLYSPVTTTADVLRACFAVVVLLGAVVELRSVAMERAARLTDAHAYSSRLIELNRLRSDFLRMVVHEIGHPLAAIVRLAEAPPSGIVSVSQFEERMLAIRHEANLLRNLVADIQAAAAIEKDIFNLNLQPVPVERIIEDSRAFGNTLPGMNLWVTNGAPDAVVQADPERIGQVLRNLLTNAWEFSPPGTPIEIVVTSRGERVRLAVRDSGPGIHPNDLERILEKFGRGRASGSNGKPGLGLGLYVSRRILQLHGADLRVSSEPSAGSEFSFELEVVVTASREHQDMQMRVPV